MNKKELAGVIIIVIGIFLVSFVFAQTDSGANNGVSEEDQKIADAYSCIEDEIGTECRTLTSEEQAFSILALGDHEDCVSEFVSNSANEECWPKGNCNLKETAIGLLALDRAGKDTSKIEDWLLNQTKPASDLTWFIEIDSEGETTCNINYDSLPHTITVNDDKTIASAAGNCLPVSSNGFWLEISSTCLEKEFAVSCDQDFKTTILYKTQSSQTIHVSQKLNSASSGGETNEQVTFKCFEEGTVCDYEGSLWGAIALNKVGKSTTEYLPYLDSFASENKGFFPEVFLYILSPSDELWTSILQNNFNGKAWQVGINNNFYNTALAFMVVNGLGSTQEQAAKDNLLNIQENNGCFGSIKDTGFLLYTGWPRDISSPRNDCSIDSDCSLGKECIGGFCRSRSSEQDCEAFGNSCESFSGCNDVGGRILDDFTGCSVGTICCSEKVIIPSCSSQNGHLCNNDEQCPFGEDIRSSDGVCCAVLCEPIIPPEPRVNQCESVGGNCRDNNCLSGETEDFSYSCGDEGGACCLEEKGSFFWVWFFVILIVIVIVLILLRNKLRLFFFRIKNKFKKGPKPRTTRPPLLPPGRRQLPPRVRPHIPVSKPTRRAPGDKEFEDTLKKLKEMGK